MLVGYMRVSSDTDRQTTDLQRDALLAAGVDPRQLFADKASGARDDRPGLRQALAYVHPGDGCLVNYYREATIFMRRSAPWEHESSVAIFI